MKEKIQSRLIQLFLGGLAAFILVYNLYLMFMHQVNLNQHFPFFLPFIIICFIVIIKAMDKVFARNAAARVQLPSEPPRT